MSRTRKFINGDVVVFIPTQKSGLAVDVKQAAAPSLKNTPPVPIGFHPFRMVINLEIFDPSSGSAPVEEFDPPIEISIRYTDQDMAIATNACRELRLGFWDGTRWLRFTESKHEFKLVADPVSGGWGKVKVKNWIDPAKAWGT